MAKELYVADGGAKKTTTTKTTTTSAKLPTTNTLTTGIKTNPLTDKSVLAPTSTSLKQNSPTVIKQETPSYINSTTDKIFSNSVVPTVGNPTAPASSKGTNAVIQYNNSVAKKEDNSNVGSTGGSTGGGSSYVAPVQQTTSASASDYSDFFNQIKAMLEQEKTDRNALAEENYKKLVMDANNSFEANRNAITKNNAYTQRWLKQTYGNGLSGAGLSNQLRAQTNYQNNLYNARQNLASQLQNALIQKNSDLANSSSTYSGNYNNYVVNPLLSLASSQGAIDNSFIEYLKKLK